MSTPGPSPGSGSGPPDGDDTPKKHSKKNMRGRAYVDEDADNAEVTQLYTQEDERQKRSTPRSRMKGWAYIDEESDGPDLTHLHSGEPIARRRREEERASRERDSGEGQGRSRSIRGRGRNDYDGGEEEEEQKDGNENTQMGGMDHGNELHPTGSMNDPPASSDSPLPTPPDLEGLPPPNQPNTLIPVPRHPNGRAERRLLNVDKSMWWNQEGQGHTNPPSDCCYECVVVHKVCDVLRIGYPCTRCEQRGLNCRNGLPSQKWEKKQILAQTGVAVQSRLQSHGTSMGAGSQGRARTDTGAFAPGSSVSSGRGRRSANAGSSTPQSGDSTPRTIVVDTSVASSSRGGRRGRPKRARSASPERDNGEDSIGEKIEDENNDDNNGGRDGGGKRLYKRRKATPLTDDQYEKKFGIKRKCKECSRLRVTCPGDRPCDRCLRTGKPCEPAHGDGLPYSAAEPPRNEDNEDDDAIPVASSSSRPGSGRPRGRPRGRKNAAPPVDPLERIWAKFNGLFNPFNYSRPEMEGVPTADVPTADRMGPLPAPTPPIWHAARNQRLRDVQDDAQRDLDRDIQRRLQEAQRLEEHVMGNLGPGMGFGGTAELVHRPRWDAQAARETWFSNASSAAVPVVFRQEPEPYNVNRPSKPVPDFGRNMVNIGVSINSQVPPPPHGDQIPWIATWNFEGRNTTETRGPLGWPYPTIGPLDHGHKHNTSGIFDPVNCCENVNQFSEMFAPDEVCNAGPAMMCEVWPEYDRGHQHNPWYTCNVCRHKQWDFYAEKQQEILLRQKLYACSDCGNQIRKEGRSWPKECLCYATKTCRDLCHLHREQVENAAEGPILIAEDYLIRSGILRNEWDTCINCGKEDANPYSEVWSCKLCREWVQDSGRTWIDRRRRVGEKR
ncbi:hypothetical protein ONS96_010690 [Cadophora gregata f. sp. sojae]|nr:hypothetical protein ONS96_010690 [Cadophora gregata f. sp. sojae]